jgi:non-ribosomal peptide synthetase component E (peptide arylation enzyme)
LWPATLPVSHNFPLACPGVLGTLLTGGRVVMAASQQPASVFALAEAEGVTVATAVPAVAQRWLGYAAEHGRGQLGSLRLLQVGGARMADELARQVRPVLGVTLQQVFGMAEGLLNFTRLDDPDEVICGTQGRPLSPGDEVRIVDEAGRDLPDGTPGLLLTRGPYTPRGYYRAPEQNARAFTADGWFASGDVVRRRPDGNLVVEGRDKDMINRLCVFVVPRPGASRTGAPNTGDPITLQGIRDGLAAIGVAKYKWPERLEIVAELPVTKVGKIDKKALRDALAAQGRSHD